MCGITGWWAPGRADARVARAMADAVAHRGPDDAGTWVDAEAGLALGHRRLSIIDLSPAGHQPMLSHDARWAMVYNGEVYNHAAIRAELEQAGVRGWRGYSDSETLLEAIALWGLDAALARAVGMFAIALWDRRERRLHLVRDRMGEKPLYYGWVGGGIAFGSELKALRRVPGFDNAIDRSVLGLYLRLNYVPPPWSIHRDVYKVPPASIVTLDMAALARAPGAPPRADAAAAGGVSCRRYWSLDPILAARHADAAMTEDDAVAALEARLTEAVRLQTLADVPVGAFLSGGIDSSTIVSLMRQLGGDVRTFTIGFHEVQHDEAAHARAIARHLGTHHEEFTVTAAETMAVIPALPAMWDEPFADASQIPTHLVARFARRAVTVALSGDGGDELFGGYNRYTLTRRLWSPAALLPAGLRRHVAGLVTALPPGAWDRLGSLPFAPRFPMLGNKAHKFAGAMKSDGALPAIYAAFTEEWHAGIPLTDVERLPVRFEDHPHPDLPIEEQMMLWDIESYLPADILCKVDRAAMAASLETRAPFLDHRVVEQAWRTPLPLKLQGGTGKIPLRRILDKHVPRALIERPKAGFGVPVADWLRGPLRAWAEDLLAPAALCEGPGFDVDAIRTRWEQHQRGSHDWTMALWSVLMFQAWAAEQDGRAC